jgi:serine protease Do
VTRLAAAAEGIVVRTPRAGSNAERAGLRRGDVILAVEGEEVRSYQDMREKMGKHQPGESVKLRVRRGNGEPEEVAITR